MGYALLPVVVTLRNLCQNVSAFVGICSEFYECMQLHLRNNWNLACC